MQWGLAAALIGVVAVLVPLGLNGLQIVNDARDEARARAAVLLWLGEDSPLEIFRLEVRGDEVQITLAGPEEPPDAEPLAADLVGRLGKPLEVRVRWAPLIEQVVDASK